VFIREQDAQSHPMGLVPDHLMEEREAGAGVKDEKDINLAGRRVHARGLVCGSSVGSLGGSPMYSGLAWKLMRREQLNKLLLLMGRSVVGRDGVRKVGQLSVGPLRETSYGQIWIHHQCIVNHGYPRWVILGTVIIYG